MNSSLLALITTSNEHLIKALVERGCATKPAIEILRKAVQAGPVCIRGMEKASLDYQTHPAILVSREFYSRHALDFAGYVMPFKVSIDKCVPDNRGVFMWGPYILLMDLSDWWNSTGSGGSKRDSSSDDSNVAGH